MGTLDDPYGHQGVLVHAHQRCFGQRGQKCFESYMQQRGGAYSINSTHATKRKLFLTRN